MMTSNYRNRLPQSQQGAALIVGLIMLLLMTILGVSSMSSSIMEEKMAGNTRDREIAFQAAEAALRAGEREIENSNNIHTIVFYNAGTDDGNTAVNNDGDTCTDGYCTPSFHDENYADGVFGCSDATFIPDRWDNCDTGTAAVGNNLNVWTTAGRYRTYTGSITGIGQASQAPRYIIEFMGYIEPLGGGATTCAPAVTGYPGCTSDSKLFRITARGYGGTTAAQVMLQSTYVKN
ncbi:MAG: PilX N-terminal domain-containing pilus assembly protein [Gammaproteobacteria bacterium]|nr:PilX N-terminal domain-containing pilus assembly protein [Gammaproteobacteria bacterium]